MRPVCTVGSNPPFQLGIGSGDTDVFARTYARPEDPLMDGYVEVPPTTDYLQWSCEWSRDQLKQAKKGSSARVGVGRCWVGCCEQVTWGSSLPAAARSHDGWFVLTGPRMQ